ncbi:MAG TPA: hypothetical protein DDW42_04915 [Desulfobacteraceae bacterium]|nr:hypothetical protein [Desulfobacteraceae bacterium]
MKKWIKVAISILVIAISFFSGWFYESIKNLDLFYSRGEYSLPSSIVVEQESSDGLYNAQILYEDSSKAFYLAVHKRDGTRLIVDSNFVPGAGYHEPLFKMCWDKNNKNVYITIDHDFGEGKLKFVFSLSELKLSKVN